MKLAFSRPTADEEETRLLFQSFRAAGFEGLQLKSGQFASWLQEPGRFLDEWPEITGAVSALITGVRLDVTGRERLRQAIAFASAIRAGMVVICLDVAREGLSPADIGEFARILSAFGGEALQSGVKLSLHHHYNQPVMHRNDFDIFFGAATNVGLTVDTAHLTLSGVVNSGELVRSLAPFIDNVHVKDLAGGKFKVAGQGEIDFAPFFAALRDIHYNGWVCADEESGGDIVEGLQECYRFLNHRVSR